MTPDAQLARIRRRFVALTALRWLPTGFAVPVLVLLLQERGIGLATIGVIVAAYSAATLLLELPTGGLADTIGRRPVLVAAALLSAVGSLILAFGTVAWVLAGAYVIGGIARALDSGPLQAWYVDSTHAVDPGASIRSGLSRAGVAESLGLAAGSLGAAALVAVGPLAAPFLVAAGLSCIHGALVLAWVDESGRGPAPSGGTMRGLASTVTSGLRVARSHPAIRRILLVMAAAGVGLSGLELLAPPHFAALLGGEDAAAGPYAVLVAAAFGGSALGAALAPAAAGWLRAPSRAAAAGVLTAGLLLAGVAVPLFGVAAVAFVAFYVPLGVAMPLVDELTHHAASSGARATVLSLNSMALQGAAILATTGLGALADATSSGASLLVPAALLAAGALALTRWPER
ncbi:MFS transporter [Demequina silvatica]|uniref:MFS transporter n=1 Tax=Demequina silvatica TaxID=1638988 RepID=UPI00078613E4|nr:MFS transporter [Demequina silvatica]